MIETVTVVDEGPEPGGSSLADPGAAAVLADLRERASAAGVEIIVRCDTAVRKIVPFRMPTRDEVENQLYSEQIAIMARSYLRTLRRDAVVEIR